MLDAGIIEVSSASFYSQILIATKPGGFRFCIDFRNLNEATDPASWPIPNIEQMIIRIGAHEPTHFAILDLTQGYHQAALAAAAKVFTAFITVRVYTNLNVYRLARNGSRHILKK